LDWDAAHVWAGDYNGYGKSGMLSYYNGNLVTYRAADQVSDMLISVVNGMAAATNITYKPLTDSSVYTPNAAPYKCTGYPCQDVQNATYVVSQITQSDGVGGNNNTSISYGGLKSHITAGISLGFRWMQTTDPTGLATTTIYNQITTADNSLNGIEGTPFSTETWFGNTRIKYSGNSWTPVILQTDVAGRVQRTFVRLAAAVEETRELNNSVVTTVNTTYSGYDAYGNPGTVTVNFNDGYIKTTTNTYNNDTTNWYLGQLTGSQVLSQIPGQPSLTRTSSFVYDGLNRLSSEIIEPNDTGNLKLTTSYGYDAFGNRTSKTITGSDIVTRVESQIFDPQGRFVTSKTNALNHTETYVTDARYGAVTNLTGPNNITTSWTYDGFGRKIGETRADGSTTTITYQCWDGSTPASGATCPTQVNTYAMYRVLTTASGSGSTYAFYDRLGRVVQANVRGFGGNYTYTQTNYDNLGRVASASQSEFNSPPTQYTTYTYDNLGRVLTATAPGNRVTSTVYNGLTTTVTFTAPNTQTQTKSTVKNSQGKVVSSTDAAGTMSYVYDAIGNLVQVTDPFSNVSTMTYNIRGLKTAMHDPDMGNWSYIYDALGQLKSQTDAKIKTISMTYDKLGRMLTRVLPNSEGTSTWTYDTATKGIGKLASVTNPNANETYTYDSLGRLSTATTSISGVTYTVTTAYDAYSRVDTVTYPETGFALKHVYDPYSFGFLQEVKNASTNASYWKINTGGVDAMNRILSETYGSNLIGTHAYDSVTGDLTAIKTGVSGNLISVQNEAYGFDGVGNLLSRSWWDGTATRNETFGYDNLNRLKTVTGPVAKTYNYDTIGNITFKSDVGNYTYPTSGSSSVRPHAVSATSGGAVTTSFTYDANGNMLTGNGKTVTYTSFNKAKTIQKGSTTSTLTYDASFNRLVKSNASGSTVYIGKLYERNTSGTTVTQKHYVYAGNNIIGVYSKVNTTTSMRYFHTDNLSSVDIITNETGGVVQRLSYDAWGKRRNANGSDAASITAQATRGFTAHEHDDEVTLINMNAREYDPIIARFISPDSIVPGALNSQAYNRYSYALNDPVSYTDPTGHGVKQFIAGTVLGGPTLASASIVGAYVASHKQQIANLTSNALYKVSQIKYVGGLMSVGLLTSNDFGLMYGWSTGDWKTVARAHATGTVIAGTYWAGGAAFGQYSAATSACYAQETLAITYAGPIYMAESAGIGYVSNYSMARIYGASAHDANRAGLNGVFDAIKTAGMRIGFENMKLSTNVSSQLSGNTLQDPKNGDLFTYGGRPTVNPNGTPGVDRSLLAFLNMTQEPDGAQNWFWGHDYIRDIFNQVSKVHDWGNSWAYNSTGQWVSYGVVRDTAFNIYSIGTMLPAAYYSLAAHDNGIGKLNQYVDNR
jgi:RHS repeat-associated protein